MHGAFTPRHRDACEFVNQELELLHEFLHTGAVAHVLDVVGVGEQVSERWTEDRKANRLGFDVRFDGADAISIVHCPARAGFGFNLSIHDG